jgi:ATP-dependent exoDNAse (exonuclease V) beta subunit
MFFDMIEYGKNALSPLNDLTLQHHSRSNKVNYTDREISLFKRSLGIDTKKEP